MLVSECCSGCRFGTWKWEWGVELANPFLLGLLDASVERSSRAPGLFRPLCKIEGRYVFLVTVNFTRFLCGLGDGGSNLDLFHFHVSLMASFLVGEGVRQCFKCVCGVRGN